MQSNDVIEVVTLLGGEISEARRGPPQHRRDGIRMPVAIARGRDLK